MKALVDAALAFAARVSPDRVEAVAERFRGAPGVHEPWGIEALVGTPPARAKLKELCEAWVDSGTSGDFLAGLLVGATHARRQAAAEVTVELAWTGPTTPFVATRRTDQVLLDLIRRAERELFLVSFVAYDVTDVVDALNEATRRGVAVRFLLESSTSHGGSLDVDPLDTMRTAVPEAELYAWQNKQEPFLGGRVHAKIAVADQRTAFLSSANLTGYALGKNMEAGVLIRGGDIPAALSSHLQALIETKIIKSV
ncbi:MAG: DISARM system phospholipase D-like protein DrmC [Rhodothermales bacterium]